jgi:hypothetical protein
MTDSAHLERIRASALFDARYYRKIHGHLIPGGRDPLAHFLEVGLDRGYLPSEGFDPALYRALVPGCRDANPLLHSLDSAIPFQPPPLAEVFRVAAARISLKIPAVSQDLELLRHSIHDLVKARAIPITVGERRYSVRVPEPGTFAERLESDRPFAYARLPHGFWDALWMRVMAQSEIESDARAAASSPPHRRALATRLCAAVRHSNGAFAPAFMDEVLGDIPLHAANPAFFRAVSFKGQLVTDDLMSYPAVPSQGEVLQLFAQHFEPEETIYDGTLCKKLLITGHLKRLPELCRERPVVLVTNRFLAALGKRWMLKDFTHVRIPRRRSQWQRADLLARASQAVEAAVARGGRPPVVLTQCGGSLAFWLITRLVGRFPDAFYIDLGQALNGWFMDALDAGNMPWLKIYGRLIIENCGLEPYYRARIGPDYQRWLDRLQGHGE